MGRLPGVGGESGSAGVGRSRGVVVPLAVGDVGAVPVRRLPDLDGLARIFLDVAGAGGRWLVRMAGRAAWWSLRLAWWLPMASLRLAWRGLGCLSMIGGVAFLIVLVIVGMVVVRW